VATAAALSFAAAAAAAAVSAALSSAAGAKPAPAFVNSFGSSGSGIAGQQCSEGGGGPDFVRVLQLLHGALVEQHQCREGLAARLAEARAALERKNTLIR
jgi:hypothetical protein